MPACPPIIRAREVPHVLDRVDPQTNEYRPHAYAEHVSVPSESAESAVAHLGSTGATAEGALAMFSRPPSFPRGVYWKASAFSQVWCLHAELPCGWL